MKESLSSGQPAPNAARRDVVAIIGSRPENRYPNHTAEKAARDAHRRELVRAYVRELPKDTIIISGGAPGADSWAEEAAYEFGIHFGVFEAIWEKPGGGRDIAAGHKRNAVIAYVAHRVVAFYALEDTSGTSRCVEMFRELGKPVAEVRPLRTQTP